MYACEDWDVVGLWSCVCANKVDYAEKFWPMACIYSTTENEC